VASVWSCTSIPRPTRPVLIAVFAHGLDRGDSAVPALDLQQGDDAGCLARRRCRGRRARRTSSATGSIRCSACRASSGPRARCGRCAATYAGSDKHGAKDRTLRSERCAPFSRREVSCGSFRSLEHRRRSESPDRCHLLCQPRSSGKCERDLANSYLRTEEAVPLLHRAIRVFPDSPASRSDDLGRLGPEEGRGNQAKLVSGIAQLNRTLTLPA
jgi:hypothetical protein